MGLFTLSSHPSPSLTIWDLNSPYISWFLIAAALRPKARRQPCWADWSLPHLMGNPVGETPTEVEWHDSLTGQQNKRVENTPTCSKSTPAESTSYKTLFCWKLIL